MRIFVNNLNVKSGWDTLYSFSFNSPILSILLMLCNGVDTSPKYVTIPALISEL